MSDFKLVGYSSDDQEIERVFNNVPAKMSFGKLIKSKAQRIQEKRDKLFTKTEPKDSDEWFVYLVDGEKWYYKVAQDIRLLEMHHEVTFLGIGRPNKPVHNPNFPTKYATKEIKGAIGLQNKVIHYGKCCYCEIILTAPDNSQGTSKTRDHIIPRNRGGKMVRDCCYACNQEKGGLMLHSYIQMLNLLWAESITGSPECILLQTKIKNANEIAKSLNL